MSQVFFDELEIPPPDYHLEIGSGPHGAQTGAMLAVIEQVLIEEQPERVLVYGDTNSTLAGALAAAKCSIPVAHVEAGLRGFNRRMPEEINRIVTDHLADLLFCPSDTATANLSREGIVRGVHRVGDVMYEALQHAVKQSNRAATFLREWGCAEGRYWLATVHRAENTDDRGRLDGILRALNELAACEPIVFPVHPRTRAMLKEIAFEPAPGLRVVEPLGYADMAWLLSRARGVLTDSGGMQKEAYWLRIPCITLRDETEWVETVEQGWNRLAGADMERIVQCARAIRKPAEGADAYHGTGSVERLIQALG